MKIDIDREKLKGYELPTVIGMIGPAFMMMNSAITVKRYLALKASYGACSKALKRYRRKVKWLVFKDRLLRPFRYLTKGF